MCVLFFSESFVWNISHFKNNSASYYHKFTYISMSSNSYFHILMKLEFSRQIFEKPRISNFIKISPMADERTEGQTWLS